MTPCPGPCPNGSAPILHLYTFAPRSSWGDTRTSSGALSVERCQARGIEYNRRSTGGGTVIMGPEVVALGLGINVDHPGSRPGWAGSSSP